MSQQRIKSHHPGKYASPSPSSVTRVEAAGVLPGVVSFIGANMKRQTMWLLCSISVCLSLSPLLGSALLCTAMKTLWTDRNRVRRTDARYLVQHFNVFLVA